MIISNFSSILSKPADKVELQNSLVKRVLSCVAEKVSSWSSYVADGEALLQRLP